MVIKKLGDNKVSFETMKTKTLVELGDSGITLRIETQSNSEDISKPGEYEYDDISLICLELTKGNYLTSINFVKVNIENINIGIITQEVPSDKDLFKDLGNLDILVVKDNFDYEILKRTMNYFDILNLILLNSVELDKDKQSLGIASLTQEKLLKIKSTDLRREENNIIYGYVL